MFPIRLEDVRFTPAGRTVLDGLDLAVSGDGITVVLGPNGAGKSVLLRMLAGLLAPDSGRIAWNAADLPKTGIAMMFQQPMLLRASVFANVGLALKPLGLAHRQIQQRTMDVLHRVGLGHRSQDSARCSPAAKSSAWRWPAPGWRNHGCCCSTNRRRRSTQLPPRPLKPSFAKSAPRVRKSS
jgi:ABC-type nitrate/sulfonate/bicarbonate transport system ATPase subunit